MTHNDTARTHCEACGQPLLLIDPSIAALNDLTKAYQQKRKAEEAERRRHPYRFTPKTNRRRKITRGNIPFLMPR
jgi:hypothetical protein